jgi:hypothetical protein
MAVGAGLIFTTVLSGIEGLIAGEVGRTEKKAQAAQMRRNVELLQGEVERGEIELGEALKRIDTLIGTAKGEIKEVMENQVNLATKQIKDQYREGLATTMQNIRQELGQRGLAGSEFAQAARRKTAVGLTETAAKEVTGMRERALNEIARQMTALSLKGGLMKEGKREAFQQFRLGALGEIMQLQDMAGTLGRQADVSPLLSAFGAARGGIGQIIGGALAPGQELQERTGTAIPELQEPKTFLK